jgi:hypothetical protein
MAWAPVNLSIRLKKMNVRAKFPILVSTVILFLYGCAMATRQKAEPSSDLTACRICKVELEAGISRTDTEKRISALLDTTFTYNPYGNNLPGGVVEYRDGEWVLLVTYSAGVPAPWVKDPNGGGAIHYPPVEEKVVSWKIAHAPLI